MTFPALNGLTELANDYRDFDFSSTVLVAIQHLLASNGSLFELLNATGLSYDRMFILGKLYSTNEAVYQELRARGVNCHPYSHKAETINLQTDYKESLQEAAHELLNNAIKKLQSLRGNGTLLVVDDGGVLIAATNKQLSDIPGRVVAVEQTRSGAELLRSVSGLKIPVVNVAESKKKLHDESPYIAASIIEHLSKRYELLPISKKLKDARVLVVGYGAVGRQVGQQLEPVVKHVTVHDIDIRLQNSNTHLFIDDIQQALANQDIVVGCVGKAWLPSNYADMLKDEVVLASGSSSNTEFLGVRLCDSDTMSPETHQDCRFEKGWVLNAGFPVNFDGSQDPISPHIVELTRMLMLNGILQAVRFKNETGLMELAVRF
jgi:S-adenosylhomocysteine hydrolase